MDRISVRLLVNSWRGAIDEVVNVPPAMGAAMLSCGMAEYVDEEETKKKVVETNDGSSPIYVS